MASSSDADAILAKYERDTSKFPPWARMEFCGSCGFSMCLRGGCSMQAITPRDAKLCEASKKGISVDDAIQHIIYMPFRPRATQQQCEYVISKYGKKDITLAEVAEVFRIWHEVVASQAGEPP